VSSIGRKVGLVCNMPSNILKGGYPYELGIEVIWRERQNKLKAVPLMVAGLRPTRALLFHSNCYHSNLITFDMTRGR
jgi:hypothetical protein